MKITNNHNLSLPLAVLVCTNDYDYDNSKKTISVTGLMKPLRAIILGLQNQDLDKEIDLADLIASSYGNAIHSFAEKGWNNRKTVETALGILGVNDETMAKVVINPTEVLPGQIPIYVERRSSKEFNGWVIRGKLDLCIYGKLSDYKSCSVWSAIYDSNSEDYSLQGSMYRWLNDDIVTEDVVSIEKMFTDWSSSKAKYDKNYPSLRAESKDYPLMTVEATEEWIAKRLSDIDANLELPQSELPMCDKDELWAKDDEWKYYKGSLKRATKIYTSSMEANDRLASEGKGEVVHFPGEVKRCNYCNAINICEQASELRASGRLKE